MKTAIILHGMPSKEEYFDPECPSQSNQHWLPWIQRELILKGILAQTPEFPEPYEPIYEKWCKILEQFDVNEDTTLIGHSLGGGFLVRWLSENKVKVRRVILVAPFLDPDHDEVKSDFFDFTIDPEIVSRAKSFKIIVSLDDDKEILDSVSILKKEVQGIHVIEMQGKGHFLLDSMKTQEFPELLVEVVE
jgi:predicted alpha/beta hydrolase family esterase